jgi:hypothetical protein
MMNRLAQAQFARDLLHAHPVVSSHAFQNGRESSGFDWPVGGNDLVMFSTALRGDTDMRAFLPGHLISQNPQPFDQLEAVNDF